MIRAGGDVERGYVVLGRGGYALEFGNDAMGACGGGWIMSWTKGIDVDL